MSSRLSLSYLAPALGLIGSIVVKHFLNARLLLNERINICCYRHVLPVPCGSAKPDQGSRQLKLDVRGDSGNLNRDNLLPKKGNSTSSVERTGKPGETIPGSSAVPNRSPFVGINSLP